MIKRFFVLVVLVVSAVLSGCKSKAIYKLASAVDDLSASNKSLAEVSSALSKSNAELANSNARLTLVQRRIADYKSKKEAERKAKEEAEEAERKAKEEAEKNKNFFQKFLDQLK